MAKMDPLFESIFQEEWPEDFQETVAKRSSIEKQKSIRLGKASAVKIPVVPNVLIRIVAGTVIMIIAALIYVNIFAPNTSLPATGQKSSKITITSVLSDPIDKISEIAKNSYVGKVFQ